MEAIFRGECTCCSHKQGRKLIMETDYSNSEVKITICGHGSEESILINKCALNQIRAVLKACE